MQNDVQNVRYFQYQLRFLIIFMYVINRNIQFFIYNMGVYVLKTFGSMGDDLRIVPRIRKLSEQH